MAHDSNDIFPIDWRPESPTCPVDWRWRRAEWRLQTGSKMRVDLDDAWIRRAVDARRRISRGSITKGTDLVRATELSHPNNWTRAELEARILAKQSFHEISTAIQVPETVIEAYEALFFDVVGRLQARSWIIHFVLGSKTWQDLRTEDAKWLWRYLGFTYGPIAVNEIVKGVDRKLLELSGVPAYWSEESRLSKEMQYMLISRAIPSYGVRTLEYLARFIGAGLCEGEIHERPPEDLSLTMSGECVWTDVLTPARPQETASKASKAA